MEIIETTNMWIIVFLQNPTWKQESKMWNEKIVFLLKVGVLSKDAEFR